jgi:hypothetical protein
LNSTKSEKEEFLQIGDMKNLEIKKIQKMSLGGIRGVAPQKQVTDRKSLDP